MKRMVTLLMGLALVVGPVFSQGSGSAGDPGIVLGGVLGNVIGAFAGGLLGSGIRDRSESLLPVGMAGGILAGSVCGSALGVHLAAGRRGRFGDALLGSLLGELAAVGVSAILGSGDMLGVFALVPFAVLPPAGAAILYSRSGRGHHCRAGAGLLNMDKGRMKLGVPEFQARPMIAPGLCVKPGLQFNVRLLSIEL